MPSHVNSDAHEWTNEIIAVSNIGERTTANGTGLDKTAGKEDPVELDSSDNGVVILLF